MFSWLLSLSFSRFLLILSFCLLNSLAHLRLHFYSLSHSCLTTFVLSLPWNPLCTFFQSTHFLWLCLSFHLLLGQRGEPGTGPPAFKQPPGRGLGPQTAPGPVYRDLCLGHWQHTAQSVPGGLVCSGLPNPSGPTATLCDLLPPGGSWGRKDTGPTHWQDLAPAAQQCHHALYPLQTQGAKRGALPAESSQDTHANVLPTSARRTHSRNQRTQPRDIHLSTSSTNRHSSSNTRVKS